MIKAVSLLHVSYQYPDGQAALHDINFEINPGEKVALIGPNGAGKSTLLLHMNGILFGEGEIVVMGIKMGKENLAKIRSMVGLVFQNPDDQLFSPTVYEDVAYGPIYQGYQSEEVRLKVLGALGDVHMREYADRVSHHLSLGEKKRIAIATVLSMKPEMLALDEPSSGLDPRARHELIELLKELPQTMLIATHDLYLVRDLLSRTIIMDQGTIVADGPTKSLLGDHHLLKQHGLEFPK